MDPGLYESIGKPQDSPPKYENLASFIMFNNEKIILTVHVYLFMVPAPDLSQ